jgi:hypothetical protein
METLTVDTSELRRILFNVYDQEMTISDLRKILLEAEKVTYTLNEFEVLTKKQS